jgi:hypothetical protein
MWLVFSERIDRDAISMKFNSWSGFLCVLLRIENIKEVAGMIQRLVPNAKWV